LHYLTDAANDEIPDAIVDATDGDVTRIEVSDLDCSGYAAPIVVAGKVYTELTTSDEDSTLSTLIQNGGFVIVIPPFGEGTDIDLPTSGTESISITSGVANNKIAISGGLRQHIEYETVTIQTSQAMSGLRGDVIGTSTEGAAVIGKWRQRSTTGGLLICTPHIEQISIDTNEKHRQELLRALTALGTELIENTPSSASESTEEEETTSPIEDKDIDRALLALHTLTRTTSVDAIQVDPVTLNQVLPTRLQIDTERVAPEDLTDALESTGAITDEQVDQDRVQELIRERNLSSFVRRLNDG